MSNIKHFIIRALFCNMILVVSGFMTMAQVSLTVKNKPVREVIEKIEKTSNYRFFYSEDLADLDKRISVAAENPDIKKVMQQIMQQTNISYFLRENNQIVLSSKSKNQQSPQNVQIKGTVSDETGEPVIGVNVVEKGTSNGTITDLDGQYSLELQKNDGTLIFSYIGYVPKEVDIRGKSVVNIKLSENVEQLNEVVVTGYGGTQVRSKLTNSIASVKEEHLQVGMFSNPAQALSGAVSGMRVIQSTGNPGGVPEIVLRGGTNLDGTGAPLIIVDGQQRESLSDINPEDIESMDVLKDAGATALYGARANNGVVLVTTKRGKEGKTSVNVKAKLGFNYYNSQFKFLNARDYLYWMRTSFQRSAQIFKSEKGEWVGTTDMSSLSAPKAYGTGNIYWADAERKIPAIGNEDGNAMWSPMNYTPDLAFLLDQGWQTMTDPVYGGEIIFYDHDMVKSNIQSPAITQDYNMNISGGNDKGSYYAGLGYNHSEGLPLDNYYQRITATFNADYKIRSWFTSYTNFNFSDAKYNQLPNGRELNRDWEDRYFTAIISCPPTVRGSGPNGEVLLGNKSDAGNMQVNLGRFIRDNNNRKLTVGQSFKFDILKNLYLKIGAIWMYDEDLNEHFDKDYLQSAGTWNRTRTSSAKYQRIHKQTYNAVANYDLVFLREHTLNALVGFEYFDNYVKGFSASGSGAPTDDFADLGLTSTEEKKREIDSWHQRERITSFFGRINYDYKGKYLLSMTLRDDGYSLLMGKNRWGVFPGFSAGWIFGREKFMEPLQDIFSFAKLRLSYGLNGNVSGIGAYELQGSYGTTNYMANIGFILGGVPDQSGLPNESLRWEKSQTVEAGLDLGILENKINANFTFYNRLTQDKYADIPLPGSSGITSFRTNNGEIRNRGFEMELSFKVLNTKDWTWNIQWNGAYNINKIIKLPDNGLERNRQNAFQVYDPKSGNLMWVGGYQEGQEPGMLYAFKAEGLYRDESEIPGNLIDKTSGNNGSNGLWLYGPEAWAKLPESEKIKSDGKAAALPIQPGDVKWKDVNNDGVIDDYDMVKMGNTVPHWTGGLSTTLRYKNISLFARMDYALDYKIIDNRTPWIMGNMVGYYNTVEATKDSWTPSNPNAQYPTYTWADQLEKRNYARNSSMFVSEGSYLAFRELSLMYALPKSLLSKWNIQDLSFTITGQNLGYLTAAKSIFSPEYSEDGSDKYPHNGGYPLPKSFILGINLTF